MKQFHPRFFIFLVLICVNVGPAATATATRFITVELWTGGKWNSDPAIRLPRVDSTFGNRGQPSTYSQANSKKNNPAKNCLHGDDNIVQDSVIRYGMVQFLPDGIYGPGGP